MSTFEPRYKDLVSLLTDAVGKHAARPLFGTKKDGQWGWITYAIRAHRRPGACGARVAGHGQGRPRRVHLQQPRIK